MKDEKTQDGAALWQQARQAWGSRESGSAKARDPLVLAAYLDGRLDEAAAAELEATIAGDPQLLAEVLALRAGLGAPLDPAPAPVVARAQALVAAAPAPVRPGTAVGGLLERLFGAWLRPAVPAFAVLTLIVGCAGAFELGRFQSEQVLPQQTAGAGEAELPDPFSLDIMI